MTSNVLCDEKVPLKLKGQFLLDIGKTDDVIWNKVSDGEEQTQE